MTPESSLQTVPWCDLSYDVAWEAGTSGVIRCRAVLNRRSDICKLVEGVNLRAIRCRDKTAFQLLAENGQVRHVEARLPKAFGPERLYLSAQLLPDGGVRGTLCAIEPKSDDVFSGQVALLGHVTAARAREEEYRHEAEIMLEGLRVLLSPATAAQRLETLATLAVKALRGAAHVVLEIERAGTIRPLAGTPATVNDAARSALCREQQGQVAIYTGDQAKDLRELLAVQGGDIAVMFLPVASDNIVLICASKLEDGFRPADVGFASRFALILQQALILKDEQDKLVQAARLSALGQMSASLAHELRQPMNTISMVAQNLELMAEAGAVSRETLAAKAARIREQVERASKIMDRIRRFARKNGEPLASVDLAQLTEGVRLLLEPDLIAAGIGLDVKMPAGLTVQCDAIQVEQVLTNLIRNAMDALCGIGSQTKTANGIVTVRGRSIEGGVVLRVEDNGPGFPADVASRPLETFYTSKGAEAGTGLGLSICHMIAREHAGSLEIGNHPKGAFVELRLPSRSHAQV